MKFSYLLLSILFLASQPLYASNKWRYRDSSDDEISTQRTTKKEREILKWNHSPAVKKDLAQICNKFYSADSPLCFSIHKDLKELKKFGSLDSYINQLNITTDINEIKTVYDGYKVLVLRKPTLDKLVLSCGNYYTSLRQGMHCQDSHVDADTVDIDIFMNPGIVANLSEESFFSYLESNHKTYKEISAEGGYILHNQSGLVKLKKILDPGGIYKLNVSTQISIINENELNKFKGLQDDQSLSFILDEDQYEDLIHSKSPDIARIITEKMNLFYQENGFSFHISHPEVLDVDIVDQRENPRIAQWYSLSRNITEQAQIHLKREN